MGNYAEWDDVVDRYKNVATRAGSDELQSGYIAGVEAYVNAKLVKRYSVPVADKPPLLTDITVDLVYARVAIEKGKGVDKIKAAAMERLNEIADGDILLTDSNGTLISATSEAVWSTHEDYEYAFSMLGPEFDLVDPDLIEDLESERS